MRNRYCVGLAVDYFFHGDEISYQYEPHFFDTEEEAERFRDLHNDEECTEVMDMDNLPFE